MRKTVFLTVCALAIVLALVWHGAQKETAPAQIRHNEITFEIADSAAEREQGLSGRAEVPARYALLFIFPRADRYSFWMKDMLVPIDIVWVREDGTVVGIEESVAPETYPSFFTAPESVPYVLETRAGEARQLGWEVGVKIDLPR